MPNSTLAQMGFLDEVTQEETVYDLEDTQARTDISTINEKIPNNASSDNKLATKSDVSAAYKPKGNATLATLPPCITANLNTVYNMTEDFVTTADFIEGAGISVEAGNEVGIINFAPEGSGNLNIKYTILGGFIDLSGYATISALNGRLANGEVAIEFNAESLDGYWVGQYVMKDGHLYKCNTAHTGAWNSSHFDRIAYISTHFGERTYMATLWNAGMNVAVGDIVFANNKLYRCTTAHTGAWDDSHFTETKLGNEIKSLRNSVSTNATEISNIKNGTDIDSFGDVEYALENKAYLTQLAPEFSSSASYDVGHYVLYEGDIYKCTVAHSGAWNLNHFTQVYSGVANELEGKLSFLDATLAFNTSTAYAIGDYCSYKGSLYRFTTAHPAGAWNSSHVTLIYILNEIKKINSLIPSSAVLPDSPLISKDDLVSVLSYYVTDDMFWTRMQELRANVNANTGLIKDTNGWVSKNKVVFPPYTIPRSFTHAGVDFTTHDDGTITMNGTATEGMGMTMHFREGYHEGDLYDNDPIILSKGTYILSKEDYEFGLEVVNTVNGSRNTILMLNSNQLEGTFVIDEDNTQVGLVAAIAKDQVLDNVVLKPMIREAGILDKTYEPYHKDAVNVLRDAEVIDGKNLLSLPYFGEGNHKYTYEGVECTWRDDGTILLNGTATGNGNFPVHIRDGYTWGNSNDDFPLILKAGRYVIAKKISGSQGVGVRAIRTVNGSADVLVNVGINSISGEFELFEDTQLGVMVDYTTGAVFDNAIVSLMICTKEDWIKSQKFEEFYKPLKDSMFPRSEQELLGAKNIGEYKNYSLFGDGVNGYNIASGGCSLLVKLTHNKDYVAQKKSGQGDRFRVVLFNNLPSTTPDLTAYQVIFDNTKTEVSFNSGNYNYAVFTYVSLGGTVVSQDIAEAMVSFNKGEYVPYAMTNNELTENKADNSVISSYVENGTTASKAYGIGEHFIRNGLLGVAIQAIASGGTFTLNTNYREGNLSGLLTPVIISNAIDLDTLVASGIYYLVATPTHGPESISSFILLNFYVSSSTQIQVAIRGSGENIYVRTKTGGTWHEWYKFTGTALS